MQIGEASKRSGLEASAIRFYEAEGVVPAPARTPAGYRDYGGPDVEILEFVARLRRLELPLDDVREIVDLRVGGRAPCRAVRAAIDRESEAIDQKIVDMVRLRDELDQLQRRAAALEDAWPEDCVCHLLPEGSPR